jgi:hypothetical protein
MFPLTLGVIFSFRHFQNLEDEVRFSPLIQKAYTSP